MRHLSPVSPGPRLCQLCEFAANRQPTRFAKRPFVALHVGRRLAKPSSEIAARPITARFFTTSAPWLRVKRTPATQPSQPQDGSSARFAQTTSSSDAQRGRNAQASKPSQQQQYLGTPDLAELAAAVDRVTKAFLAQPGIPSEEATLEALKACEEMGTKLASDTQDSASEVPESSHLLHLDPTRSTQEPRAFKPPRDMIGKISDAAYEIITHPAVVITPQVLKEYVGLQIRLGKPESLPQVFEMYANKPRPRLVSGFVQYVEQNPDRLGKAIDSSIAETALAAAIEARNLDVAVGIVESTYATNASRRLRLLVKALLPATGFAVTPIFVYLIASNLSLLQNSMDQAMATNVAFAAILAYVGFTGTIGAVAVSTANDQMKRVTWAPGTPLRQRWLRESERAAFDKIACGFGFTEQARHGEEEGEEFQLLREFILRRGMILDAVELMPGMT